MNSPRQRTGTLRRCLMGFVLVTVVPVLLVGLFELGLRAVGTGHPTDFFIEKTIADESVLRSNHRFTERFFPGPLARAVLPMRIAIPKPDTTYRIIIFGESAANGDPDPAYGFGRHLEVLLEERFPGTDIEIVNTAITAINSHVILPIARDSMEADADLWIVYMGNNEMIGPFGAGTIFGSKAPPLPFARASLAVRETRIGQLMKSVSENLRQDSSNPESWEGINMFTKNLLPADDPGRLRVYDNFRANLESILDCGRRAGVPVLLSTVASNLRNCAPFASLNNESLSPAQLEDWNQFYDAGKALETGRNYADALDAYGKAAALDPGHAELQYRIGRCHGLTGNLKTALIAMEKARDADGLAVRADSTINGIIRDLATEWGGDSVTLVDAARLIAARSPGGIPGKEFFYEHVHFTLIGNYHLAEIMGEHILPVLTPQMQAADTGSWEGPGICQRNLAATLWDKNRLWSSMADRQSRPPFTSREGNRANVAHCEKLATEFSDRINSRLDRLVYERALEQAPDDYLLHARFGEYLLLSGEYDEAIRVLNWVTRQFPDFEGGHQQLGVAYLSAGRPDSAKLSFRRVLEINPDYTKARLALEMIDKGAPD